MSKFAHTQKEHRPRNLQFYLILRYFHLIYKKNETQFAIILFRKESKSMKKNPLTFDPPDALTAHKKSTQDFQKIVIDCFKSFTKIPAFLNSNLKTTVCLTQDRCSFVGQVARRAGEEKQKLFWSGLQPFKIFR